MPRHDFGLLEGFERFDDGSEDAKAFKSLLLNAEIALTWVPVLKASLETERERAKAYGSEMYSRGASDYETMKGG